MFKIENKGVAPIEALTVFGATTARDTDKIGQFGSGFKHGITLMLRMGLPLRIFLGEKEVSITTEPMKMGDRILQRVVVEGVPQSWTLDFGALDWTDDRMAYREFVSNAIDQASWADIDIRKTDDVCGKEGTTRVFCDGPQAQEFFSNIGTYFLHASNNEETEFIEGTSDLRVYRRGVLIVKEIVGKFQPLLGLYNFKDIKVDECRIAAESDIRKSIANFWVSSVENFTKLLKMAGGRSTFETEHALSSIFLSSGGEGKSIIRQAYESVFGSTTISLTPNGVSTVIKGQGLYYILRSAGVLTHEETLSWVQKNATEIEPATNEIVEKVTKFWNVLKKHKLHGGKSFPRVYMYTQSMEGGSMRLGYATGEAVYFNRSNWTTSTIIEELVHYTTGANDFTYEFQTACTTIIAELVNL